MSSDCSEMSSSVLSNPQVAELIRTGRLRKGLNLSDLAEQAGVSRTTLHQLERGAIQTPQAKTLSRIAAVLELPPEQMQAATAESRRSEFDFATNPAVQAIREQDPERFAHLTDDDWRELASQVGVGGGLTSEGVVQAIER